MGLYDPDVTAVQFNLIGSHDTPRARTVMGGDPEAHRLATLLQLVLPGAPSIYYGDELGMEGAADPDCRRAYPTQPDGVGPDETRPLVRAAIRARAATIALAARRRSGVAAATGDRSSRSEAADGRRAIVAVNAGAGPSDWTWRLAGGQLDGRCHGARRRGPPRAPPRAASD